MRENIASDWAQVARETALEAVWTQWSTLNPMLTGSAKREASSVVDPEALVLASLGLWDEPRGVVDQLAWWALRGATLVSVRRLDTLGHQFPASARERIGRFAAWARAGGDLRWKDQGAAEVEPRSARGPFELSFPAPATMLLRLRAAFGVSAKPDVFAFLLTQDGVAATPKDIARAVGYAEKNVRAAAHDLSLAAFINENDTYPVAFSIRPGFARSFLRLLSRDPAGERVPEWVHWAALFPFLLKVTSWWEPDRPVEPSVLSARARALYEEYRWVFRRPELKLPDPNRYPGEHYISAFGDTLHSVSRWVRDRL